MPQYGTRRSNRGRPQSAKARESTRPIELTSMALSVMREGGSVNAGELS